MSEAPTPVVSVARDLHDTAEAGHPWNDDLRAAATRVERAFETWLLAAEHAAHNLSAETSRVTKEAWDEFQNFRAKAAELLAKARAHPV